MRNELDFLNNLPSGAFPAVQASHTLTRIDRNTRPWITAIAVFLGMLAAMVLHTEYARWRVRQDMAMMRQSVESMQGVSR